VSIEQTETRVRFSAEGMAEVVGAFQQVSAAGKKSAKDTGDAFAQLQRQFSDLGKSLIGGLSLVYLADKLKEAVKGVLDTAEGLTRLSRQTGLSTDAIQAFGRAARESGLGTEEANSALAKFSVQMGKAEIGSKQSTAAFSDLGISVKELQKLTPDQRLQLVATALSKIQDPARRARDEVALFGRAGQQMDQAIVRLGSEGLPALVERLKELGLYLDQATIGKLLEAKEKIRDLEDISKGLATQFTAGLAPALADIAGGLAKVSAGGEGFRKFGELIGGILKVVSDELIKEVSLVKAVADEIVALWNGMGEAVSKTAQGKFTEAVQAMKNAWSQVNAINSAQRALVRDLELPEIKTTAKKIGPGSDGTSPAPPPDPNLAKARVALIQAQLENELKLYETNAKLELDAERGHYQAGEISLREYFARRAAILNAEYDKQIEIAQKKLAAEERIPVDINSAVAAIQKATKEEQLRGQIAELQAQRKATLAVEANTLAEQERTVKERSIAAEEKLLSLEGKRTEAARLRLQLDIEALQKELQAAGRPPAEIASAVGQARTQGEAKIGYDDTQRKAQADMLNLTTEQKAIQDQINSGQIFSIQGEQQILELDRQRLPLLEADAKAMTEFANTSKDPTLIAQAAAFNEKIKEIKISTDTVGLAMKELRAGIESSIGQGLDTFLKDAISHTKTLGQAFDAAAKQIMDDLIRIALKIEEEAFLKALFGGGFGFGGGGGGGGGSGFFAGGGAGAGAFAGAATGGLIQGPGTGTSDSIPLWVSDQEYVVNSKAVQAPGVLPWLEAINKGAGSPSVTGKGYASGGLVGSIGGRAFREPAAAAGAPPAVVLKIHPDALHMTLRDWFEREIADQAAKR
jgi:hypothetical protein